MKKQHPNIQRTSAKPRKKTEWFLIWCKTPSGKTLLLATYPGGSFPKETPIRWAHYRKNCVEFFTREQANEVVTALREISKSFESANVISSHQWVES